MRALILILLAITSSKCADAGSIIQITRQLRMTQADPVPPKDFYIDMGKRDGLKDGEVLSVYRHIPITNVLEGAPYQLMKIQLGEIKVVVLGEASSIARIFQSRTPTELPAMESNSFMLGDMVEVKNTGLPFR